MVTPKKRLKKLKRSVIETKRDVIAIARVKRLSLIKKRSRARTRKSEFTKKIKEQEQFIDELMKELFK